MPTRSCVTCGKEFEGAPNSRYCSPEHKRRPKNNATGKAIKAATKELVTDDAIRQVLQEELRDQIGQHVRDNLLVSIEKMTGLMPKVVEALEEDLATKDFFVRKTAYGYLLRYLLPFAKQDKKEEDNDRTVVIIQSTPTPDLNAEVIEGEVEPFEINWPVCMRCAERKHPDNMMDGVCSACRVRDQFALERGNPSAD